MMRIVKWVTSKFDAVDPMARMTSREMLANFRDKFVAWSEEAADVPERFATMMPGVAQRDVKAGAMVTAKDVSGTVSVELGPMVIGISTVPVPVVLGSVAHLKLQPGVKDARNDGPGRAVVTMRHDATQEDMQALANWHRQFSTLEAELRIEREPDPLQAYVKAQMVDVPANWVAEMWRARVLGMLEQTIDRGVASSERLRLMTEYVTRVRQGAPSEMVGGLSTTPAVPRWWKGEAAVRPERMGVKRGRVR